MRIDLLKNVLYSLFPFFSRCFHSFLKNKRLIVTSLDSYIERSFSFEQRENDEDIIL